MDAPVRVDLAIEEGFAINLGRRVRLEAISLPGHVGAELGYFERSSGTLILGDAVTRADIPFFQGHVLPAQYRATLAKLHSLARTLPIRQIAPAHYARMDVAAFGALLDRTAQHLDEVDALVASQVRDAAGPVTLEAVWRGVCAAAGKQPEFRSLAMVEAHLRELMEAGRVARPAPDQYVWLTSPSG
jgi:glyoxylase-like metal-dependent hydrolase (beta-lactamase superfamily II)